MSPFLGLRAWAAYLKPSRSIIIHGPAMAVRDLASAVCYGGSAAVDRLLAHPLADPAADDNYAFRVAAFLGRAEDVALLLADPRVDPSARANAAIKDAATWGHAEVVALLLADPRVDPAADNNYAIRNIAMWGRAEVAALLLAHPRVDPAAGADAAIRSAARAGHAGVAALLLDDPRVDPAALDPPEFAPFRARPPVAAALARRRRWSPLRAAFLAAWWGAAVRDAPLLA